MGIDGHTWEDRGLLKVSPFHIGGSIGLWLLSRGQACPVEGAQACSIAPEHIPILPAAAAEQAIPVLRNTHNCLPVLILKRLRPPFLSNRIVQAAAACACERHADTTV